MKLYKISGYLVLFAALLASASCGSGGNEGEEAHNHGDGHHEEGGEVELTELQMNTVGIQLGHITRKEIASGVKAMGELTVNPQDMAEISVPFAGIVKSINVKEGENVKAGQTVATIENPSLIDTQLQYAEAAAALALALKEKQRQEQLAREGAGIRKNLERAEAEYASAKAKEQSLGQLLKVAGIAPEKALQGEYVSVFPVKSPISGVVNKIFVPTGGYADNSRPVMTVTDNSKVYASLRVFEKDINKIHTGQRVDLTLTNGGENLEGKVTEINNTISPETKSIDVKVSVEGGSVSCIPGMAVTAYLNSGEEESDVLPEDAVTMSGGKEYIYLLEHEGEEDGVKVYHFIPVEVVTDKRKQGWVEVKPLTPIPDDAVVVTAKAFYLASMAADHGEHNH